MDRKTKSLGVGAAVALGVLIILFAPQKRNSNDEKLITASGTAAEQQRLSPAQIEPAVTEESDGPVVREMERTSGEGDARLDRNEIFADLSIDEIDEPMLDEFLERVRPLEYRLVRANSDLLREQIRDVQRGAADSLKFRLTGAETLTSIPIEAQEYSDGWNSGYAGWSGRVADEDTSIVAFVASPDGTVSGNATLRSGQFVIEQLANSGAHIIWKRDPKRMIPID